jgi:hypothetical protein
VIGVFQSQLLTSVICKTDLLWCVGFNPLLEHNFIRSFVLVGEVVVMLNFC